ncbi:DUF6197 family protein [Streptomyces lavendofoliae]|uniref:Uncharacterized protein n=1 Tax=Streptomyces lavendofoliae TaxID=67314 RepID=A0A918M5M7_9ACTN|nr:hypothetical protein [Streptomyces lavendofoliae]GGU52467.1 hypothetical protein GCM10010274_46740 [Streptomyces lavendofoliae]
MTTTLTAATRRAARLTLDERLTLTLLDMDEHLDQAAVAFEVNTAHMPAADPVPAAPILPPAPLTVGPYTTPIAAVLQRALARLRTVGWCAEHWDEQGAICLVRAIRTEAGGGSVGAEACQLLLDVIRAEFGPWETVPSWNDAQVGPAVPLRILGQAADQAAARGI